MLDEKISLTEIKKSKNRIEYVFDVSPNLKKFFTETPFVLEYYRNDKPLDISKIPDSVLAIPFVGDVIPIAWITGAKLEIPELDKDFCDSLDSVKRGYAKMIPHVNLPGDIIVKKIVKTAQKGKKENSAMFFSGGVDSWCTLVRHIDEKPDLISVWGSDIDYCDEEGWANLYRILTENTTHLGLNHIVVRSSFRKTIYEDCLTWTFEKTIGDNWWHGMQHGIGIIVHAAPANYLNGVKRQYIAASLTKTTMDAICASRPEIDGAIRFAGCRVFHDAVMSRQAKIEEIVKYHRRNNAPTKLHVCWETKDGHNCQKCEKCYRTIYGLLVLGEENLDEYGFSQEKLDLKKSKKLLTGKNAGLNNITIESWNEIRDKFIANNYLLKAKKYYKRIKWLKKHRF